jgi:hypothetical protein
MARKTTTLPSIPTRVLPKAAKEGQRKMSNVIIATRKGIIKQIVGQREEERRDRDRR